MKTEKPDNNTLTSHQALWYEVNGSWWAWMVPSEYLQNLAAEWFARKVKRKMARCQEIARITDKLRNRIKIV